VVGVWLALVAGRPVAGQSLGAWRDRRAPLERLWGHEGAGQLMARCQASRGDLAVIGVLTAAAETRVLAADAVPLAARLAELVDRDLPAEEIANRVGLSPRQLHHLCVDRFGLPPSVLRRTSRLHRAARLYQAAGPGRRLADLAQAAGYADQAHLSRELRSLTGLTPRTAFS